MGNIQTVGPNEALIVSGGCCRPTSNKIIRGGWCWNTWMLTNIQRISLEVMTINPRCEKVQSCQGVPVSVTAVVHCKITSAKEFMPIAVEQFLGKSIDHIKSVVLRTVEGHMRAVIGTQSVEDICKRRKELASLIRASTTNDLSKMGVDILSLTIKDIKDDVEYLSSGGKKAVAEVKRDAAVSAANAESDAKRVEDEFDLNKKKLEIDMERKCAEMTHNMNMAKHELNEKVGKLRAEAAKAYDLQLACLQKDIRTIEMDVKSMEYDRKIEMQAIENERKKTELEIYINLPTSAEVYQTGKQTEAFEVKQKAAMTAEEYRIRIEGEARVNAIKAEGLAEANGLKIVAEARNKFNNAAVLHEMLKILPEVAAEIASPLTKFDEIVLISDGGGDKIRDTSKNERGPKSVAEAAKFASTIPLALKAVGGNVKQTGNILNSLMLSNRLDKIINPSS